MKKILIVLLMFIACGKVYAQSEVLINEFTIEPTQSVELINNTSSAIDVSNWYIDDSGGTTYFTIPQNSILYPNSCMVFSGDFNLNKSSADTIRLFNNTFPPTNISATLIDSFSYSLSPGTGISHLRQPDKSTSWTTSTSSFGKFNQTGGNCLFTPTATPTPTSTPTPMPTLPEEPTVSPAVSYLNVLISEVMVAPETGDKEWVEFYNDNDFAISLENWYIDDEENAGSSPKSFSLTIPAKGYSSFELSSSMFNNDGDSVRLLDPQKNPKDSLEYTSSGKGETLGRISFDEDRFCLQEPTKGQENGNCIDPPTSTDETAQDATVASSTPLLSKQKTASNKALSKVNNAQSSNSVSASIDPTGSVLGSEDEQITPKSPHNPLSKPFSLLSFSYSILTMASILLKMKMHA